MVNINIFKLNILILKYNHNQPFDINQCKRVFDYYDRNHNGYLEINEVKSALDLLGFSPNEITEYNELIVSYRY